MTNTYVTDIKIKFTKKCSAHHATCKSIQDIILENIHEGNTYPPEILDSYILFLSLGLGDYYYPSKKCLQNPDNYLKALTALISFNCPSSVSINTLISANCIDAIEAILTNGYDITKSVFMHAITSKKPEIAEILSKYEKTNVTSEHLNAAAEKNMGETVKNILNRKIPPTNVTVEHALNSKNVHLVKDLISMGAAVQINDKLLEKACKVKNYELMKLFLDLKINPTKECFKTLVTNDYYSGYGNRYYAHRKKYSKVDDMDDINNLIDLLVSYGYKPDYDDVVLATKNNIKIKNIELFEIKLDEKFLELCAELNFYPYKFTDIKPNVKCLEQACKKSGNLTAIKNFVKGGLKPDISCLQAACKKRSNLATIRFLVGQGVTPDFACIRNCGETLGNKTLSFLLQLYKEDGNIGGDNENKKEILDDHIDDQDEDQDENEAEDVDEDHNEVDGDGDGDESDYGVQKNIDKQNELEILPVSDDDSDFDLGTKIVQMEKKDNMNSIEELTDLTHNSNKETSLPIVVPDAITDLKPPIVVETELEPDEPKKKKVKGKIIIKAKKSKKNKDTSENTNIDVEVIQQNITLTDNEKPVQPQSLIIKITQPLKEIKLKEMYPLGNQLSMMLTNKKNSKMIFVDIKQKLLEYINKNDLFDKNDKFLIKIDSEINKISGLEVNKYLNFMDFDNFVHHCILR